MRHRVSRAALVVAAAAALVSVAFSAQHAGGAGRAPASFASRVAQLSERPGYFDTDNLISNEKSYLHVIPDLPAGPPGGAYIGVGPDQNFSYIARVKPS